MRKRRRIFIAIALLATGAAETAPHPLVESAPFIPLTTARLPGYAAELAERPLFSKLATASPAALAKTFQALATATPDRRQAARWDYALAMIGTKRAPEALGALDTMLGDDADMALVPAFRLARGIALASLGRNAEAVAMLTDPMLGANPEACMWRLLAQHQESRHAAALAEVRCAIPAINQRARRDAAPFILAASDAAMRSGRYQIALAWLRQLPDGDHAANILRGQVLIASGNLPEGRLRLDRVRAAGSSEQKIAAELALVEALSARHQMPTSEAMRRAERIVFLWHGGEIEQRALTLAYDLAVKQKDDAATLRFGGMMLRYGEPGARAGNILAACQKLLFAILQPGGKLPLADAAGLFWDNRDLAPTGPDGDRLLDLLAGRLAQAKLYERAADLLVYQMRARAKDIEKGPISERVARYYLLAGFPGKALLTLRESDQIAYPPAILGARHRVEAVALYQLGKTDQALAMLADMPDMAGLRGEMLWRRRDWQGLIAKLGGLPEGKTLTAVDQAVILRQAVAMAMTGREGDLAALRARYGARFANLPSAAAFDLLTGPVEAMTSEGIAQAMTAIPTVSVAGEFDALLDTRRQTTDSTPPEAQKMALAQARTVEKQGEAPSAATPAPHHK